jgi:hypothetical protein
MGLTDKLDDRLLNAMGAGATALPEDMERLRGYMRMIQGLLGEKAEDLEATWAASCATDAEIVTLQELEAAVIERTVGIRAASLGEVIAKLEIWKALAEDCADGLRDRLVLSALDDLTAIARVAPR